MTNLAHVNIRTADLERSVAFYRDLLGLSPVAAATRPGSRDHVWMSDDEGRPCIHLQRTSSAAQTGDHPGMHHLALACVDPEAWREKLSALAIDFQETEFTAARMLQFTLLDPDSVRIELLFGSQ